ncbi:unnamed protein product [Arabis nemorensis]|uniref:Uncharacterized protein n=1 Tax=Arabis nemorensis TaxID=586526 RepID=A0A565CHL2_9BRAS|nr:unnamed protein product [Arabis nemorensis]
MDSKRKEELKELVDFAFRYLPLPHPCPPFSLQPVKKTLCDSEIKKRRDELNARLEAGRLLMKAEEARANKTLATKADDDSDNAVKAKAYEKLTKANIKTIRHESDEEDKYPPRKRTCVE